MTVLYEEDSDVFFAQPVTYIILMTFIWLIGPYLIFTGDGWAVLFGTALIMIGAFSYSSLYFESVSNSLTITNNEFIWEYGLFSKQTRRINMSSVRTGEVYQSPIQLFFNAGNLRLWSSGDNPELVVNGLSDADKLNEIISQYASQRNNTN